MNYLKAIYKVFKKQETPQEITKEIISTNNAIEFIWDTQRTVRNIDK